MAATDDHSLAPRVLLQTEGESLDFVASPGFWTSRRVTPSVRYDKHDVIADVGGPVKPVIPTPLSLRRREPPGWVDVGVRWTVTHQRQLVHSARLISGDESTQINVLRRRTNVPR